MLLCVVHKPSLKKYILIQSVSGNIEKKKSHPVFLGTYPLHSDLKRLMYDLNRDSSCLF